MENEIKALKERYNNDIIEKAKCEANLEHLKQKKEEILNRCTEKNIKPEEIGAKKLEAQNKLQELVEKAKQLFGDTEEQIDYPPF